jgi:protein-disulfide isomerase
MPDAKSWYKHPLMVIGAVLGGLISLLVLFFIGETIYFMIVFKLGKQKPAEPYESQALHASIANIFNQNKAPIEQMRRLEGKGNPTLGNASATVHIVEFIDYDCPNCLEMAPIIRSYMKDHAGDAYLVIRDYPATELHPYALDAAVAARCVLTQGQDLYWKFHDWLFDNQGNRSADALTAGAGLVGADTQLFSDCFKKRSVISDIELGLTDGAAFGIAGTPTFFFNGVKIEGRMMEEVFKVMVDEARKHAAAK